MLHEIDEPTPEELAKTIHAFEKVRKVLKIAKEPISLGALANEEDSHLGLYRG